MYVNDLNHSLIVLLVTRPTGLLDYTTLTSWHQGGWGDPIPGYHLQNLVTLPYTLLIAVR